jgi:hypothetical protein
LNHCLRLIIDRKEFAMRAAFASFSLVLLMLSMLAGASEAQAQSTITIGQTAILSAADSGNANLLLAQQSTLTQTATIDSLSFYVTNAAGNLILGIYDATGASGGPGNLKAVTRSFKTVMGWNTVNVTNPVSLAAGKYWLAYLPNNNNLSFVKQNDSGNCWYYQNSFKNGMPSVWGTKGKNKCTPTTWSFYATLTRGGATPPPVAVNGVCGSSNGTTLTSAPATSTLCSTGTASTVSGSGPWTWSCAGSNGGTNASCSAQLAAPTPVNGACGSSNDQTLTAKPTSNLCSTGTASTVSGTGPWTWSCAGSNGGTTASCSAQLTAPTPVNGACGSSNGTTVASKPTTNLCSAGTASTVSGTGPWTWSCAGSNGGTNASCSAQLTALTPVNGVCSSSNGQTLASTPTSLCSTGTASTVSGTGPWSWSCAGSNGGTTVSCSASLAPQSPAAVNGACSTSNGQTLVSTPTNLCGTGTASAISGTGPWSWTCAGSNGGTTASCSAQLASSSSDPTVGVLPSYNDTYANWKNAGLQSVGGIPTRTTVCATVNPLGGGKDDFTNIQNAINNCPTGEVVQLGAGAFTVKLADLPIQISSGITLRGTGNCGGSSSPYCQTSINVTDGILSYTGGTCGTDTSHQVTCPSGGPHVILIAPVNPDYSYSWAQCGNGGVGSGCGAISLTADAAQGQTTIQVASTSGLSVGQWVLIDEASGAGWVADPLNAWTGDGSVWAASDWLSSSGSPATGRVLWSKGKNGNGYEASGGDFGSGQYPYQANSPGCWFSYCDRPTAELHRIASIGTGSVTFDDPLTIAFRQSGSHNAQIYGAIYNNNSNFTSSTLTSFLQNAGVENLSVLRGATGGIEMEFCAYCWIKNTEVGDWYGGGIDVEYSARSELNTDYVHHCWDSVNSGGEYALAIDLASTEILITNSITNFAGKGMVARAGGAGSVISYNYVDDTMYDAESGIGDYWVEEGLNASHYSGPHHVLFEGNWADNMDNDNTHGNSDYITFFRNQGTGLRTPFTDPSLNKTVDDFTGIGYACSGACFANAPGPLRAAGPSAYNYWFAFVGNVLGVAGETTAANGWTYQGDWNGNQMFMLGWNAGPGGQDPYLDGTSGSYIFRHGNFDYVNDAIADWTSGYSTTLPNSFYLSGKPAFFSAGASCTYAWPWVTPTGASQIQTNSCKGSGLPAKARYEAGTPFAQP